MKRETVKHTLIIAGLALFGALSVGAGLITPPTLRNLAWILLATLAALSSGAIGGWVGGMLGAGRAVGGRIGMRRRDCGKRGARFGLLFGAVITGLAWHDPGYPAVVGALGGGLAAGLFAGLLGMFITSAEASFWFALYYKARNDPERALESVRQYLRTAEEDPDRAWRVRRAEQLLRELEGQPAQDGWGSEPEAAGAPQGRGIEPEGAASPLGRGIEPEASAVAEDCSTGALGTGVTRPEAPERRA